MARVRKDTLYVGTVHPPGLGRPMNFGPKFVRHCAQRMQDMLADGLQIPVSWEHQSKAKPKTREEWEAQKAEMTKLTLGHVAGAQIDADGVLVNDLEVPNDEDRKRLPAIRFASPEIKWDWTDGRGKTWPGPSITHVAVTPRPVQHDQKPFDLSGTALSTLQLSLTDYVHLGSDDMADEPDFDADDDTPDETPADDTPEPEPDLDAPEDGGGQINDILEVLGRLGLVLPPDTTAANLLERLHAAALTMEHHTSTPTEEEPPPVDEEAPVAEEPTPAAPPNMGVMMSMDRRLKAAEKRLSAMHRGDLRRRIDALKRTGRINVPIHKQLLAESGTVQLSLGDDGELSKNDLLTRIAAYEALPKGAVWPAAVQLSDDEPTPVPAPEGDGAPSNALDPHVMGRLTGNRWTPAKVS